MSSQQHQPKQSQLVKVLQRENVISYKKKAKPVTKQLMKSQNNNQDEDNVSSQSLQSGVYSEDVSRLKGKINPLPELGKQKKRFITKNLLTQEFTRINNYQEKQVRQHDNLMLKQKNNFLSSQNMKLKTKISTLQKQNIKLQKLLQQQPSNKSKTPGLSGNNFNNKQRFRPNGSQNLSMKLLMKNLKKQLQDLKKQNQNIKSSIKFTTISELECERDAIMQETARLRQMVEDEQTKRISLRLNQQGMSNLQQKLSSLQDKNSILMRDNNQLKSKLKLFEDKQPKQAKMSQGQKNLNKQLYNVRKLLKQKQNEVEVLREQIKTASSIQSIAVGGFSEKSISNQLIGQNSNSTGQFAANQRKPSVERPQPNNRNFDKRIVSKSAQKTGAKINQKNIHSQLKCQNCKKLSSQIQSLKKKIAQYQAQFQAANPLILPTQPVQRPSQQQILAVTRYIQYRFKAHHLTLQQSQKYLLNTQNITEQQLNKQITVQQFLQNSVTEPFVLLNKRYIEVFLMEICFLEEVKKAQKTNGKIKLVKQNKLTKKLILENYRKLMPAFTVLNQSKQEEMFLQIAELVTSYYQQILAAMSNRKNGQGTISQKDLTDFFLEIELEKEYIEFIVTQIILESIDLEKLNYFAFFQIFYMPQQQGIAKQAQKRLLGQPQQPIDKKKKFQVEHVVKQQDQQYEQSKSYVDASRQKTVSKHGQSFGGDSNNPLYEDDEDSPGKNKNQSPQKNEQQENYGEQQEQQYQLDEYEDDKQKGEVVKTKVNKKQQKPKKEQIKPKSSSKITQKPSKKSTHQGTKKKQQRDDSYAEQFEQQKMNSDIQQQSHQERQPPKTAEKEKDSKKIKKALPVPTPQQLIQKPYQIQDIEDEYNQQFQN